MRDETHFHASSHLSIWGKFDSRECDLAKEAKLISQNKVIIEMHEKRNKQLATNGGNFAALQHKRDTIKRLHQNNMVFLECHDMNGDKIRKPRGQLREKGRGEAEGDRARKCFRTSIITEASHKRSHLTIALHDSYM